MDKNIDRFNSRVAKGNGCHLWLGSLDPCGYGTFSFNGKNTKAHRFAWSVKNGEIPKGMMICHHCDNPSCVNPDHLFIGTQFDNMRDMHDKNRHTMRDKSWVEKRAAYDGANNPNAKLTADIVRTIRSSTEKATVLAAQYGVHRNIIYGILKRTSWKNI